VSITDHSGPRAAIAPFLAMEVARDAARLQAGGRDIARLDVGQPHWPAPEAARKAATRAIAQETLGYSDGLGALALRRAISAHYGARHDLDIDPERIIITTGASGAFTLTFLALFHDQARVAMASPGYPPYRHILHALGYRAHLVDGSRHPSMQLRAEDIEAARDIDGVLIASPANPTGAMLHGEYLAAVCKAAHARGAPLISDEIYHGLTYAAPAQTALAFDDNAIVINSFSKYWAMTGWRVGWIVAPRALVKPIERLAQNLTVAPPSISQAAALGALQAHDECEARRAFYADNRALLLKALPTLGLKLTAPADGAFYMLLDVSDYTDDSLAWCARLLNEADVALTPGIDFCETRGRGWVRLAYCQSRDTLEKALDRLAKFLPR
jgi:aspartate/methionine/tyrosine aminotransferase